MDTQEAKIVLETALICSQEVLNTNQLKQLFLGEMSTESLLICLQELQQDWSNKGLELVQLSSGWRFQSKQGMQIFLERLYPEKPPKYSRAVLETLAIIAYRQPVTRGDIEAIRGVTVNAQIIRQLEDRGWIEVIGQRDAPGKPTLFATTLQFLNDLNLCSLSDLPELDQGYEKTDKVMSEKFQDLISDMQHDADVLELEETVDTVDSVSGANDLILPLSSHGEESLLDTPSRSAD